ncbi:hypothetical protein ACLHIM_07090 [Ligilactobacillus sp. LYQ112]|uniref:hypothetical protein n=1 Tax=Ligilactobacillus sp. LYQ112 TaxID=3391060 RepID=UPI00398397AF
MKRSSKIIIGIVVLIAVLLIGGKVVYDNLPSPIAGSWTTADLIGDANVIKISTHQLTISDIHGNYKRTVPCKTIRNKHEILVDKKILYKYSYSKKKNVLTLTMKKQSNNRKEGQLDNLDDIYAPTGSKTLKAWHSSMRKQWHGHDYNDEYGVGMDNN